jgi:polyisoprenoid-binding protein YceI
MKRLLLLILLLVYTTCFFAQTLYKGNGTAAFISNAPLEVIKGESNKLAGIVDTSSMNFAFKINVASFEGFNSPLQKEHFNEHYLETSKYPDATFLGTLITTEDCTNGCETEAVCKGKFTIHGVTQIITIPVILKLDDTILKISGQFTIKVSDFNINIPKIVLAKIASEIEVKVAINMLKDK